MAGVRRMRRDVVAVPGDMVEVTDFFEGPVPENPRVRNMPRKDWERLKASEPMGDCDDVG